LLTSTAENARRHGQVYPAGRGIFSDVINVILKELIPNAYLSN
jgi:hypothetical protein